jgi:BirA family biotin operon repressor/biotin-[acetyl-CoA-carboxylase] ligase
MIDIDRVRRTFPDRRIDHHQTIGSTMTAAAGLPLGSIVVADEQTEGQGRYGRSWHSAPGLGLYCTVVLRPQPLLTLALGLATVEAIGLDSDLRWPNDVLLGRKKIAGILVQLVDNQAIAGIGINLNHTSFPPDLAPLATSLRLHTGREFDATDVLIPLLHSIDSFLAYTPETILQLFTRASSYAVGRRVVVHQPDGVIEGTTAGLDSSGFLMVRQDNGTVTLIVAGGVRAAGS